MSKTKPLLRIIGVLMSKILIGLLVLGSVSAFAAEFVELHSGKSISCASLQQKSFNAVENFIKANNVKGNYTAVAMDDGISNGCRLLVTLQNSDYKLVSKDLVVYGPSVWEDGTISERLSSTVASVKKGHSYVLHTVSERLSSTLNKQYEIRSVSIVRK
jgi:hypothetical protein